MWNDDNPVGVVDAKNWFDPFEISWAFKIRCDSASRSTFEREAVESTTCTTPGLRRRFVIEKERTTKDDSKKDDATFLPFFDTTLSRKVFLWLEQS